MPAPPKKLKFVQAFDKAAGARTSEQQSGYEKVDDNRVLERYFHPILYQRFEKQVTTQQVTVTLFDFSSFTATVTTMTLDKNESLQGAVNTTTIPFSQFENKQALRDAHRALEELGGTPPPLDDFSGLTMATKGAIAAPDKAQFKQKP